MENDEVVIRISRRVFFGVVAAVIVVAVLAPIAFWQFQRASERGKAKKELAWELRLLASRIQTGINQNDFAQQVARVRAAYAGAKGYLTPEQNGKFAQIDLAMEGTTFFWNVEINIRASVYAQPEDRIEIYDSQSDGARIMNLLNLDPHIDGGGRYLPQLCVQELMVKADQAISSFLEGFPRH
jgi:type II secretory pathway pseudopilin PulG